MDLAVLDDLDVEDYVAHLDVLSKSTDPFTRNQAREALTRLAFVDLEKVGPKGYIHGWIKVGAGSVGERVHHPEHGHGTVSRVGSKTSGVTFDSGHYGAFEHKPHDGEGGHFVERATKKPTRRSPSVPEPKPAPTVDEHLGHAHTAIGEGRHADAVNHLTAAADAAPDAATRERITAMRDKLGAKVTGAGTRAPRKPRTKPAPATPAVRTPKPAPPSAEETVARLHAAKSREEAHAVVEGHRKADLTAALDHAGIAYPRGAKKQQLQDTLVHWTIGRKLDADSISGRRRSGDGPPHTTSTRHLEATRGVTADGGQVEAAKPAPRRTKKPAVSRDADQPPTPSHMPIASTPSGRYTGPAYHLPAKASGTKLAEMRSLLEAIDPNAKNDGQGTFARLERIGELQNDMGLSATDMVRLRQEAAINVFLRKFREANGLDMSDAELHDEMARRTRDAFAGRQVAVRTTTDALSRLLDDGRFKTQFETHTSGGLLDPGERAKWEAAWFGLTHDADPRTRPVYGYVMLDGIHPATDQDHLAQYGSVQVVLKDAVRDRTAAMFGDSLNQPEFGMPSPINDPSWRSFTVAPARGMGNRGLGTFDRDPHSAEFRHNQYAEATVHGGVTLDDVEEVILPRNPPAALRTRLERAGVRWRVLAGGGK